MELDRRMAAPAQPSTGNLADILERVLDKGIVVAGDIAINLLDIELLTIKLRLLIASADTAREMGISWWENDPFLTGGSGDKQQKELPSSNGHDKELSARLDRIESALAALTAGRTEQPAEGDS